MLTENRMTFPNWNMHDVEIPERSQIYDLSPRCLNSADVESLTSYINRLSEAHCISTSKLIKQTIIPYLSMEQNKDNDHNIYSQVFGSCYSINGTSNLASNIAAIMNLLTLNNNKEKLTLLGFSEFVSVSDFKRVRHWCPYCLESSRQNREPIYEKLIWFIKSVTVCIHHKIPLQSICNHCGSQQKYLAHKSKNGYCSNCSGWLGSFKKPFSNELFDEKVEWEEWIYNSLMYLFELTDSQIIRKDFIEQKLRAMLTITLHNNEIAKNNFAGLTGFHKRTIFDWISGGHSFSLESLLILTYCSGLTMEQFLTSDLSSVQLEPRHIKREWFKKRNTKRRLSIEECGQMLKEILNRQEIPPLKLSEVVKKLGYSSASSITTHFPEECKLISKRFREYQSNQFREKRERIEKELEYSIMQCIEQGLFPSKRILTEVLGIKGLFSDVRYRNKRMEILKRIGICE